MSNFAFGTYRVSDQNPEHISAIKDAIIAGIDMIDTSTNYMDGGAERAIALAFKELTPKELEKVKVVSKFGYIQGTTLQKHKKNKFEEVVEYSDNCYHSISPSFLKHQLTSSLDRLNLDCIDCYLLHNPEYFILDAIEKNIDSDIMLHEMFNRIYLAFLALEEEVKNGRINSYGISSNSFSKPSNSIEFLPYENLVDLANKASREAGNETHSFTTIQLPINLLEQDGLECASWAKENYLRVLVNRPLNAQKDKIMYRLADYYQSDDYYRYLNELLEVTNNSELKAIHNLVSEMDKTKHKFEWIGAYDTFLYAQIIPHIKKTVDSLEEESINALFSYLDIFLQEYKKMIAYECSINTREALREKLKDCNSSLQQCAFDFLLKKDNIDYILVGMRKLSYISEIIDIKNNF